MIFMEPFRYNYIHLSKIVLCINFFYLFVVEGPLRFIHDTRTTVSQNVQTRFPVQLTFAKFLSKIKGILIQCQYHGYSTPSEIFLFLDRNLAKAICTGNRVCTSCDILVLAILPLGALDHLLPQKINPLPSEFCFRRFLDVT